MSTNKDETQFWNLVEAFIEQANQVCETADPGVVSAALLNAASRFNAFVVANASLDRKEFGEEQESALSYLTGRYRELLREDLQDYYDNYKVYIRAGSADDSPDDSN
jgi:hypothetical protein